MLKVLQTKRLTDLSPSEYEIFYTIASLKEIGEREATFSKIHQELNHRRVKNGNPKRLSKQAMNHHLTKLSQKPFMQKRSIGKNTLYSLKNGLWKLPQTPPLCINITDQKTRVMPCDLIKQCKFEPLSSDCLQKLATFPNR